MDNQHSSPTKTLLGLILVVAIVAAVLLWGDRDGVDKSVKPLYGSQSGIEKIKKDSFQAVFLTNGQTYFGRITSIDELSLTLENVFYLQEDQNLQVSEDSQPPATPPAFTLVKLGKAELHGPEDTMVINMEQILFWENLKSDSKVVQAIQQYKP